MEYIITIDKFEGPLDLLLHLIKDDNIDIYDIEIGKITKQYLDYIKKMEQLNLNIASSYLVMAAELIEMKASMLLPNQEEVLDEYEEDPKDRLIKRLIEYQNYKEISSKFQELEIQRKEIFTKDPSDLTEYNLNNSGNLSEDIGLSDLLNAFEKFLNRKEFMKPLNTKIANKEYSISIRSTEIKKLIKTKKRVSFEELFEIPTKDFVVITFLAVLNLAKERQIKIEQENNFSDIYLCEV